MQSPLVSVLMTAYNREKFIAPAIESVLASHLKDFELIIVDDVSSDKTVAIARSYAANDNRVKVFVNEQNLGDYPNRNKAASYARGKYIKFLDSDDIMYPHCLDVMVGSMEQFPEAGFGLSSISDPDTHYPVLLSPKEAYNEHISGYSHFDRAPGSSIIRKDAFNKVGGFTGLRQLGDFEFWLTLACYYPLVKFPAGLYWSRTHEHQESKTNTEKEKIRMRLEVIQKVFSKEKVPLTPEEQLRVINAYKKAGFKFTVRNIFGYGKQLFNQTLLKGNKNGR
jgi:glycosyltransferase involved in cell wall biosynthesis